eukprot:COSAG01_NODE_9852_length_2319_cov_11.887838_3_plen_131_part_00
MPARKRPSSAGRTPAPDKQARARREEQGTHTKPFTPQRVLNFDNFDQESVKKLAPKFTAGSAKKLDVRGIVIANHLAIVIPAYGMDGWVSNLADGIALPTPTLFAGAGGTCRCSSWSPRVPAVREFAVRP